MAIRAAHDPIIPARPALRMLGRPKVLALLCIAVLVAAGWLYLGLMLAGMSGVDALAALCRPSFGAQSETLAQAVLLLAMWCAMAPRAFTCMAKDANSARSHCGKRRCANSVVGSDVTRHFATRRSYCPTATDRS